MSLSARRPSKTKEQLLKAVQDVGEQGEPKKRLNADVERSLYRRIKAQSAVEDRSISEITRELWIEYLRKNSNG